MTESATQTAQLSTVASYILDEWWVPEATPDNSHTARDANTGEPIAKVSTDGLATHAVVHHARTVGQGNLGELSIHQRALRLKELAQYLNARREDFYPISAQTGATKIDSMIDIDGGIGVLFTMASKARRELPNANVVLDGPAEALSRDGSFLGTHIYTRIPGVTVQINAFNFPVWGMLEKFAPAFIAGVPTIVKPATPTGYLTAEVVRAMIESGFLPAGSLQLISGSARDLLDHLDYRDMVAFTGSASTANTLKAKESIAHGGVRFTAETDSLNAAILGPDAAADTPEFEAFVRSVATEMTAKAGQKCTAVRRIIVPAALKNDVVAALSARLTDKVRLGDPRVEGVSMGALASLDQLSDVRAAVNEMIAAGGELAYGSLEVPEVLRLDGSTGVVQDGAFMGPVLLEWADGLAPEAHSVEAFGPVSSVLSYASVAEAVDLAARGAGSLVASVCSNDPLFVQDVTLGIAAHHGRVLVLNREDARTSTGHGSPVPHLVHGGPGRAGGGEELGGMRAVKHHMQRTAVQGSPNMLTAVTGVWHAGADQRLVGSAAFGGAGSYAVAGAGSESASATGSGAGSGTESGTDTDSESGSVSSTGVHPFRKSLAELRIGDGLASDLRKVDLADISAFAESTGDTFYAHTNEEAAAANPFFPGIVAHGYLLISWAAGLFVEPAPGPVLANYGLENLRFITPVAAGDSIRVVLTAKQITPREDQDYGEVRWDAVLHNQHDEVVATYDVLTLVAKQWPMAPTPEVTNLDV